MHQLDAKSLALIHKDCKGKQHIKLTVGSIINGQKTIHVFDHSGETENKNYIYEIGSITKTFTASLMVKYILEGQMSLDDSIAKYLTDLDAQKYYPTLKRLATHTSGYSMILPLTKSEYLKLILSRIFATKNQGLYPFKLDLEKMKMLVQKHQLQDKDYPWQYSNFGMALLGYAIGIASDKGYWDTMNTFIQQELGLPNTYTGTCSAKNLPGFTGKNTNCGNWVWNNDLAAPAGDLSSTADDLLAYAELNMNDEKPYLSFCHSKQAPIGKGLLKKYDMGLGWLLHKENNHILWHNGGTGAFTSYLTFDKNKKVAAVVLANYLIDVNKIGLSILEAL